MANKKRWIIKKKKKTYHEEQIEKYENILDSLERVAFVETDANILPCLTETIRAIKHKLSIIKK